MNRFLAGVFSVVVLVVGAVAGVMPVTGIAAQQATPVGPPAATPFAGEGQIAEVNGIKLYYEIHGEGEPLLLIHGGLGNSDYWDNQTPVLAEQFQVIVVDSRGHGRSTFDEQPISYELMASDMLALMDYLDIPKASILGWSDGGIIGLQLAITHPERLDRVVAFGANYDPSGVRADIGENATFNAYIDQAAGDYQRISPNPERWDAFLENIGTMWATEPNFTEAQLTAITTPMLILDGEEEEAIDIEHTKKMASLIPTAELVLMPGSGHFAMLEQPEVFNRIVLDFLTA